MSDEALEMKIPFSNLFRFFSVLFLGVWSAAPLASAQTRPSLAVQLSAGQPALSLKGDIGTVYSIQCATDLSPTNHWTDRTILQVQGTTPFGMIRPHRQVSGFTAPYASFHRLPRI